MSLIWLATSRPAPKKASEIAVVITIATVMVRFRRSPAATSEKTKLSRMSAPHSVHAPGLVANEPALFQLDDAAAHRVDDVVVVGGHQDRGAGPVDALEQQHDVLAGVGVEVSGGLVGEQDQRPVDERPGDRHPLLLTAGQLARQPAGLAVQADQLQYLRYDLADDVRRLA